MPSTAQANPHVGQSPVPEPVRLATAVWFLILGLELLHQVMSMVMLFLDPSELRHRAHEQLSDHPDPSVTPQMFDAAIYTSIVFTGLLAIVIMLGVAGAVFVYRSGGKRAATMRRMLTFFGIYFVIRTVFLYGMSPDSSVVPVGVYIFDGALQILVGVGAALALYFSSRKESLHWVGDPAVDRADRNDR